MQDLTGHVRGILASEEKMARRNLVGLAGTARANGLEGGHVYGHDGVRDYWTRQWAMIDSHVKPVGFSIGADGTTDVDVNLTARDLEGNLLFDKMGVHIFRIEDGLITRFDIR
jgi:hypothetical protein